MKKTLAVLVIMSLLTVVIAACSRDGGSSTSISSSASGSPVSAAVTPTSQTTQQPNIVHMDDAEFVQSTITIKKGERITLIDDSSTYHIIANGTWQSDGLPKYEKEAGAPAIDMQFHGKDSHLIGPFSTAGIFHLYCTIHQGMSLTVIVK